MYYNKLRYNILKRKKFLNKFNEIIKIIISKKRKKKKICYLSKMSQTYSNNYRLKNNVNFLYYPKSKYSSRIILRIILSIV